MVSGTYLPTPPVDIEPVTGIITPFKKIFDDVFFRTPFIKLIEINKNEV